MSVAFKMCKDILFFHALELWGVFLVVCVWVRERECVYHISSSSWKLEGLGSPRTGVMGPYKSPCRWFWKPNLSPLPEQQVLLTNKLFL